MENKMLLSISEAAAALGIMYNKLRKLENA